MEEKGVLTQKNSDDLNPFCKAICASSALLLEAVPTLSREIVHELTLLTLGPQLRGGSLNTLGAEATQRIFDLIHEIVKPKVEKSGKRRIDVVNAAGRSVRIEFSSDPDICIREKLPSGSFRNLVAIEIKGGRDVSNIHNRIGEAEKSHQKARKHGFVEFWTMVGVSRLNMDVARSESPTTDKFYRIQKILDSKSEDFIDFRENLMSRVGIGE